MEYDPISKILYNSGRNPNVKGYHTTPRQIAAYIESHELKQQLAREGITFIPIHDRGNTPPVPPQSPSSYQHPLGLVENHEELFRRQLMGKITSLIQIGGERAVEEIVQDFSYSYVKGSWSDMEAQRGLTRYNRLIEGTRITDINIYNSSSCRRRSGSACNRRRKRLLSCNKTGWCLTMTLGMKCCHDARRVRLHSSP